MRQRVVIQGVVRDEVLNVMSLLIHPEILRKRLERSERILMITEEQFVSAMSAEKLRNNFDHLVVRYSNEEIFNRLRWLDLPIFWILDFEQDSNVLKKLPSGSGYAWVNRARGSVSLWVMGVEEEYWPSSEMNHLDHFLKAVILCRLIGFSMERIQNDVARLDIVNF